MGYCDELAMLTREIREELRWIKAEKREELLEKEVKQMGFDPDTGDLLVKKEFEISGCWKRDREINYKKVAKKI